MAQKRDIQQEITDKILAEMEQGHIPWVRDWSSFHLPFNRISGNPYHGINHIVLSMLSGVYGHNEWLTYRQAQQAGGTVRKDEKGIGIIKFKLIKVKDKTSPKGEKQIPMLRHYTVFNIDQCDNIEPRQTESRVVVPDQVLADVQQVQGLRGVQVIKGEPAYAPGLDVVRMPAVGAFESNIAYAQVAFHEFAHWTGHKSRLARFQEQTAAFDSYRESYAFEELVAELTAAFCCAVIGIESTLNHSAYLQSWIKALKNDKKYIFQAASKASKAANFLLEGTDYIEQVQLKAA